MRESSHCFVNNNRACVVISSQLYDRRAIDSPLPTLPLVTSLQHLAYLTSTAPRIREILTLDGGLERLITIVGGCLDLAFPAIAIGPTSAAATPQKPKRRRAVPFKPFTAYENGSDGQDYVNLTALSHTYGFAFQCLVNVGVRGSEQIRTRVVEAGVLQIVSRILSGFLGQRRKLQLEQAGGEQEQTTPGKDNNNNSNSEEQMGEPTPRIASTPAPVMITTAPTPMVAAQLDILLNQQMQQSFGHRLSQQIPAIRRTNTPDTLASVDVETDHHSEQDFNENENEAESSGQENEQLVSSRSTASGHRRARSTTIPKLHSLTVTPHSASTAAHPRRSRRQQNASSAAEDDEDADDSSAPSPTSGPLTTPMEVTQPDGHPNPIDRDGDVIMNAEAQQPSATDVAEAEAMAALLSTTSPTATSTHLRPEFAPLASSSPSVSSSTTHASLPSDYHFKEDDVLHCLHLLAYLSKYPHVRAVFHDPMNETARPCLPPSSQPTSACSHAHPHSSSGSCSRKKQRCGDNGEACSSACTANHTHDEDVMGDEDCGEHHHSPVAGPSYQHYHHHHQHDAADSEDEAELERAKAMAALPPKERKPALEPSRPPKSTANNVFSLVEQFTHRPSSDPSSSSSSRNNPLTIKLPADIQYWAGVIMRNACRKDEQKGGIRQCANMSCGVWERFPREFAKCRRCRKAKYCSKSCQRRAWQAGHRYWCSARQDNPPQQPNISNAVAQAADHVAVQIATHAAAPGVEDDDSTTEIRVLGDH